jgi:23S rRNA pseudouridine1911/1915/1917 synthase
MLMIDDQSAGTRLDLFLSRYFAQQPAAGVSRAAIQKLIIEGRVLLNDGPTKSSARLKAGDRIKVETLPPRDVGLVPEALPLTILYEDSDMIVINKSAGMVVHPAAGRYRGTLVNAILYHCPAISGIGGERRPGIVHRLDKDTSGVMVLAKNDLAMQRLVSQFKSRSVHKEYVALVAGLMEQDHGIINRPIGRHRSDRKRMSSVRFLNKSREAVTEWLVEGRFPIVNGSKGTIWYSLVRLVPRTGRTHQIRVHLADSGFPLVGDKVYGFKRKNDDDNTSVSAMVYGFPRQALHAEKLSIDHVRTGRRMEFHAPLPDDINGLICLIEQQSRAKSPAFPKRRNNLGLTRVGV